ncbi:MAG: hypothetical protein JRE56_09725 [Deltaproteobacteria bacterium]|nr:hypothetical protein [Deltaproteobacteria bacterium]
MPVKAKLASLFLICLLVFAAGCVETAMLYHGAHVTSVPVVALQEGPSVAGRWETFDMTIDYKYQRNGDNLELSGQAALSQHYQMNYASVLRMQTYLFFLDQDARVLETAFFVTPWSSGVEDIQEFSKSYPMPFGTTALSFGYSGSVNGMDSTASFYELPLSRQ